MRKGQKVSTLTNRQLLFDHMLLHKWYRLEKVKGWSKEDIVNDHVRIVLEILKRGLDHPDIDDALDKDSMKFYKGSIETSAALKFANELPDEIILHTEFMSLVGSFIEENHPPNDIDIIYKCEIPVLREVFSELKTEIPLHMNQSSNSTGQYVPIYQLVLRKVDQYTKNIYDYKIPMGSDIPKPSYEFSDEWEIEPEEGYYVEPKILGEHIFIHKDDMDVTIFGAVNLSESAKEILVESGPEQYIVEAIVDANGHIGIFDMLRHSSTELVDFSYASRRAFLNKFELMPNKFVYKVPSFFVDPWETSDEAILAVSSLNTQEIIMKDAQDQYYLDGTNPNWKFMAINLATKLQPGKANFQALKANTGYGKFEFNNIEPAWMFWGKGFTAEGGVAVEEKFDGFRCLIHKTKDEKVYIFTEDKKRDLSANFPRTVETIKKNFKGAEFIIDSELVRYDKDGETMPRQEVAYFIHGKQAKTQDGWRIDDKYAKFHVFDCLYLNGTQLTEKPWSERQKALKQVLEENYPTIERVIPVIVKNESAFKGALKKQSRLEGSEGAMMKFINSDYPLDGRTASWAKYKQVVEVHLEVIKVIQKKAAPSQVAKAATYMYDVAYSRKGELIKIGTTYSTNVKASVGDILTVTPVQVIYNKTSDKLTFMFPRVKELNKEIKKPDSFEQLMKVAELPKDLNT